EEGSGEPEEAGGVAPCPDPRERGAPDVGQLVPDSHREGPIDRHLDEVVALGRDDAVLVAELAPEEGHPQLDGGTHGQPPRLARPRFDDVRGPLAIVLGVEHLARDLAAWTADPGLDRNVRHRASLHSLPARPTPRTITAPMATRAARKVTLTSISFAVVARGITPASPSTRPG